MNKLKIETGGAGWRGQTMCVLFNVDTQQLQIYFLDMYLQILLFVFQSEAFCLCEYIVFLVCLFKFVSLLF